MNPMKFPIPFWLVAVALIVSNAITGMVIDADSERDSLAFFVVELAKCRNEKVEVAPRVQSITEIRTGGAVYKIDPNLLRRDAIQVEVMAVRNTIDDGSVEYAWTHWAIDQPTQQEARDE